MPLQPNVAQALVPAAPGLIPALVGFFPTPPRQKQNPTLPYNQ
jgi:hypothetical protein